MTSAEDRLSQLPPLREVIAKHDLWADKRLGQHFLLDLNVTRRIARAAGSLEEGTTVEVGPGPGGLTRALLEQDCAKLVVIEKDARCLAVIEELEAVSGVKIEVRLRDALTEDIAALGPAPIKIVANLPYNISTALLTRWLELVFGDPTVLASMVLMFQTEVAERICAQPGNKAYGRLSVITQWLCHCEKLFHLPNRAFTPPPQVSSTVLRLTPKNEPLGSKVTFKTMERLTAAAFGQRRKMLRQSLKSLGVATDALLEKSMIDGRRRAEDLGIDEYQNLAFALESLA